MTTLQKRNLLRSVRDSFETRLSEIRSYNKWLNAEEKQFGAERENELAQCIRFCNYLEMVLIHEKDFELKNLPMLEYIGLKDLYDRGEEY